MKKHLLKLLLSYWFIFLVFVPLSVFFSRPFWKVYKWNVGYGIIDFLGLADLFETPTMNATWWFMSLIILLYILFPVLCGLMKWSPEIVLGLAMLFLVWRDISFIPTIPYIGKYFDWIFPFSFGIYIARYDIFERIQINNRTIIKGVLLSSVSVFTCIVIRIILCQKNYFDAIFGLSVIMLCLLVLSKVPVFSGILEQLGKYSGAIFMFHTFIFSYYFKAFIYWFKYPPLIFLVMTAVCYAVAVGLECLKKLMRYDKLVAKVRQ